MYQRSKFAQTAAASNGVPSVNFTPSWRWKVQALPSAEVSQLLASSGTTSVLPGLRSIRPSKICLVTRNVSPSLAKAGSRVVGSADAANTITSLALEPLSPPVSRSLWAHADSASAPLRAMMVAPLTVLVRIQFSTLVGI